MKEEPKKKKGEKILRTKVKEFYTIYLEKVKKYENKKRSLKCMLIKLSYVVANAYVEIYYCLILSNFLVLKLGMEWKIYRWGNIAFERCYEKLKVLSYGSNTFVERSNA